MEENYQLALLYFVHLLIGADGVADRTEVEALDRIKQKEEYLRSDLCRFQQSNFIQV